MPVPMMNIINGGAHADNSVDIQEFMILPVGAPSFSEALRYGAEIFHALKSVLHSQGLNTAVGDEGGFAPDLPSNQAALDTIIDGGGIGRVCAGREIYLGLDVASSEFYSDGRYRLASEGRDFDAAGFCDYLAGLVDAYPIIRSKTAWTKATGTAGGAQRAARATGAAGRRRPVRHQHAHTGAGHREKDCKFYIDKTQPNRYLNGNS